MCLHRLHQCTLTLNAIDLFLDEKVLCIGSEKEMATSDHEEADTKIVLHVHDSLEKGSRKIMIRTVDTDIVVILIGHFHSIVYHYPDADLRVAFGTGKHFRYFHINTVCGHLGREQSCCLPPFHGFIGYDSTLSFYGETKKTAWATWSIYPEVSETFVFMVENTFARTDCTAQFLIC